MDFQRERRKNERNQVKTYQIDTNPRIRKFDKSDQQRRQDHLLSPPVAEVFAREPSPHLSSEHSTLTTSFHSTGNQYQYQETSPISGPLDKDYKSQLDLPLNDAHYRHSSSSIDHRTLNLIRFEQNQRLINSIESRCTGTTFGFQPQSNCSQVPNSFNYYQHPLYSIKQSNRTNKYDLGLFQSANRKRSSIHCNQNPRTVSFQRHLLTPVPQPPRPPTRHLANQESSQSILNPEMAHQTQTPINKDSSSLMLASDLQKAGSQDGQQHGSGSLDNIQMIVDEDSTSLVPVQGPELTCAQYMFATTDEPFKIGTIKPAPRHDLTTNRSIIKSPVFSTAPEPGLAGTSNNNDFINNSIAVNRKCSLNNFSSSGSFLNGVEQVINFDDLNPTLHQLESISTGEALSKPNCRTQKDIQNAVSTPYGKDLFNSQHNGLMYDAFAPNVSMYSD